MCTGLEILLIAGTAVSAGTAYVQGQQQKKFNNFQAAQATADAAAEREAGAVRADKTRKMGRAQQSEARAALAAGGVEVGSGTPLVIDDEIFKRSEEDALQEILYGSRRGDRLDQEGQGLRMAGSNAGTAGTMGAVGSVLSGGAQLYGGGWRRVGAQQRPAPVEDRSVVRIG